MSTLRPQVVVPAIVPAAGRGGRMGTAKQLLDVDGRPMLLGVVDALLDAGVAGVVLVTSRHVEAHLPSLPARVAVAVNEDAKSEMIDSIRIGLDAIGAGGDGAPEAAGFLVCPCDAARLTAADVRRCLDALAETPDRIVIATHTGRRGHPMIFPAALAPAVRSAECDRGLNRLARNRPQQVREVPCDSAGTTANVNTPADYDRLR